MSKDKANERINKNVLENHNKKSSYFKWIIIVVICVLAGIIVFLLTREKQKPNNVVKPDNIDQIVSQLEEEERTPPGTYEVSMNTNWEFEKGDSVSKNAFVENSTANQNTVYFTISLKDSDEVIFKSPYLEVGSSLRDIKLDTVLSAGQYDAVITYHLVDEDYNDLSEVSLYMQITIKQ